MDAAKLTLAQVQELIEKKAPAKAKKPAATKAQRAKRSALYEYKPREHRSSTMQPIAIKAAMGASE